MGTTGRQGGTSGKARGSLALPEEFCVWTVVSQECVPVSHGREVQTYTHIHTHNAHAHKRTPPHMHTQRCISGLYLRALDHVCPWCSYCATLAWTVHRYVRDLTEGAVGGKHRSNPRRRWARCCLPESQLLERNRQDDDEQEEACAMT